MIPLLLIACLAALAAASSPPSNRGQWTVFGDNGLPCLKFYGEINLTLSYVQQDDNLAEAGTFVVPADATTLHSSCSESVSIGSTQIDSQVLQLDFPQNEGWNVRLAFTRENKDLEVEAGDWALYMVNITANYSSMPGRFENTVKDHVHTYYTPIDFTNPPDIASDEFTRIGDSLFCPSPQGFIINQDPHVGPTAFIRITNVWMQAFMSDTDFGKKVTCPDDQTDIDLVPVIVSAVLAALVVFTLVAYFVYRSRLPTDILDMTQPEFEEEDEHHGGHKKAHEDDSHHDNYGYTEEEDHRF